MEPETERSSAGFSLQDYLAILRRRRAVIAQAFILVSVLGIAQALMEKNVYESSAKLLVDGPSYNLNTIDAGNPLSSLFEMNDQQTVDTQVVVLQAQPLLDEVRKEAGPASLSVSNIPGTNVIEVSGESSSPPKRRRGSQHPPEAVYRPRPCKPSRRNGAGAAVCAGPGQAGPMTGFMPLKTR